MATVHISTVCANTAATGCLTQIDSGAGYGVIDIYDGVMPNDVDDAITTQVKLGTLVLSKPCGSVANGVLTFTAPAPCLSAIASGIARFARFKNSAGVAVIDGDITKVGGVGSITVLTVAIAQGGPIEIVSIYLAFK